jgi:hypothetical protein
MQNGVAALRARGADGFLDQFRALDQALVQDHTDTVVESEEMHGCVPSSLGLGSSRPSEVNCRTAHPAILCKHPFAASEREMVDA